MITITNLAVDLDGVVVDIIGSFLPHLSRVAKRTVLIHEIDRYEIHLALGIPEITADWVMATLRDEALYETAVPVVGAIEGIGRLQAAGIHIEFLTSRPEDTRAQTESWLREHGLIDIPLRMALTSEKPFLPGEFDAIVEDDIRHVASFLDRGVKVFLHAWPWNLHAPSDERVYRKQNWEEIVSTVLGNANNQ